MSVSKTTTSGGRAETDGLLPVAFADHGSINIDRSIESQKRAATWHQRLADPSVLYAVVIVSAVAGGLGTKFEQPVVLFITAALHHAFTFPVLR